MQNGTPAPWEWLKQGLRIGEKRYGLADLEKQKAFEFAAKVVGAVEILSTLRVAKQSFAAGKASYAGARHNLMDLITELSATEYDWDQSLYPELLKCFVPEIPIGTIRESDQPRFSHEAANAIVIKASAKPETPVSNPEARLAEINGRIVEMQNPLPSVPPEKAKA